MPTQKWGPQTLLELKPSHHHGQNDEVSKMNKQINNSQRCELNEVSINLKSVILLK